MKRYLVTAWIIALVAGAAWAQEKKDAPPQLSDNGPSLEVTMKFIKDKVEAKAEPRWGSPLIEADPATCELTETRNFHPGQLASRKSFSFREVEKLEVTQAQDEDGNAASDFVLKILMTTNKSVHERYTQEEKKAKNVQVNGAKWHVGDRDYGSMSWFFSDEDVANRVAKAMIHAVELCGSGSKPEPF